MRRSANGAARYAAQTGFSSRKQGRKWHYKFGKSWNSISLPTRNQRLARNLPMGLSKLGQTREARTARGSAVTREHVRQSMAVQPSRSKACANGGVASC